MLRVRDDLIRKMYKTNMSKYELVTAIELIKVADQEGITQIYYKDMVKAIGCNVATVYNCLSKLEEFEIIERSKNDDYKKEMTIGIVGNNFEAGTKQNNYVKLNNEFFCDGLYNELNAGEIRVMLYLMFRTAKASYNQDPKSEKHDKNKMYYNNNYKSIAKQLGITKRMAKIYLKGLLAKKFISIGEDKVKRKSKKYDVITVAHKQLDVFKVDVTEKGKITSKNVTALQPHYKHCIKNFCRRLAKKTENELELNNTAGLIEQYRAIAQEKGKDIYALVQSAIKSLKGELLNSKTVHNILKALLEREGVLVYY